MLEVADIFRRHNAAYRATHHLLPSQLRALQDIEAYRTAYFGGHLKQCEHCERLVYAYHSCRNRCCPKCHGEQTARWLAQQQTRLLPGPYFQLVFTLPQELRALAFAHQKIVYGLLLRCAAAALQKLARDPQYLGGQLGALAVLHTWTRELRYHPYVHLLVTGGGLSAAGKQWLPTKHPAFLMPEAALAKIFRAKLCAARLSRSYQQQSRSARRSLSAASSCIRCHGALPRSVTTASSVPPLAPNLYRPGRCSTLLLLPPQYPRHSRPSWRLRPPLRVSHPQRRLVPSVTWANCVSWPYCRVNDRHQQRCRRGSDSLTAHRDRHCGARACVLHASARYHSVCYSYW